MNSQDRASWLYSGSDPSRGNPSNGSLRRAVEGKQALVGDRDAMGIA